MDDDDLIHELRLPAGTRSVRLGDLPAMLATAIHGPPPRGDETDPARIQAGWSYVLARQEIAELLRSLVDSGQLQLIAPVTGHSPPARRGPYGGLDPNLLSIGSLRDLARRFSIRVTVSATRASGRRVRGAHRA